MPADDSTPTRSQSKRVSAPSSPLALIGRLVVGLAGLAAAGVACVLIGVGIALAVAYPNLPDVTGLADYQPKLPLRVLSADGRLIGEFGEERRNLMRIDDIPDVMKNAVLAIEDARFFEHSGVDYRGMLRAALANLRQAKSQGASTITMQVARNVYLSAEKSYTRKIYEVLLTFKLEHMLTKEQILEIYMNQIFLGHRAYGFAAASQVYFGKPLKDLTVAEAAMLAGLPKAPSAYNPVRNPKRARARQRWRRQHPKHPRSRPRSALPLPLKSAHRTYRPRSARLRPRLRRMPLRGHPCRSGCRSGRALRQPRPHRQLPGFRWPVPSFPRQSAQPQELLPSWRRRPTAPARLRPRPLQS